MKLLLDEMYPGSLAAALRAGGIDAVTVRELGLAGCSDLEIFGAAVAQELVLLTENVGDFARIAAEHSSAGQRHPGLLIALSSRFSRRPAGARPLIGAIKAVAGKDLGDRVAYLQQQGDQRAE